MQRFVKIAFLVFCFVFSKQNFSQDIRGGWIEYKWVSGYTYSITANLMIDSTLGTVRSGLLLYDCSSTTGLNLNGTSIAGKVKIGKYDGLITFPGPVSCAAFIDESSRAPNIRNMPQSHQQAFHVYTIFNVSVFSGPNNTPTILNPPITFVDNPNTITYNPGAYDIDGDSLSYELIHCSRGQSLSYLHIFLPNTSIDNTGTLTIPKDSTGLFAFCIKIVEWRKDINGNWQAVNNNLLDFTVDMISSVGIKKLDKKEIISLYPNPTSNILNIKTNSKINSEIEITNYLGQTILKQKLSESIDVSKLVPGCYFIRIDNSYSKFIKE